MCVFSPSVVSDSVTPWTVACQAPLSVEFFRQEYWSGLPFPTLGHLPEPRLTPGFLRIGRWIHYHCTIWEAPDIHYIEIKFILLLQITMNDLYGDF